MIERHGSIENWKAYMREIAAQGGKNGKTGGFASQKVGADGLTGAQRASKVGTVGGTRSRRGPTPKQEKAAERYEKNTMSFVPNKKAGFLSRFKVGV